MAQFARVARRVELHAILRGAVHKSLAGVGNRRTPVDEVFLEADLSGYNKGELVRLQRILKFYLTRLFPIAAIACVPGSRNFREI